MEEIRLIELWQLYDSFCLIWSPFSENYYNGLICLNANVITIITGGVFSPKNYYNGLICSNANVITIITDGA